MIVVDTNVVSETMRLTPEPRVIDWLDSQAVETLFLSAVSLAELLLGVAALPNGRRKEGLTKSLIEQTKLRFGERILAFDAAAAHAYAQVVTKANRIGPPMGLADAQIAATATVHGFVVATRDTMPFEAAGLPVIDPWRTAG